MNKLRQYEAMLNALRDDLTDHEAEQFQQELRRDPEMRASWEEEQALERCLQALPNAPVSSNFTARVLQAARREEPSPKVERRSKSVFQWLRWHMALPLVGAAAVSLILFQMKERTARQELAATAKVVADIAGQIAPAKSASTKVELLGNFEAVRTLAHVPAEGGMDVELYMALLK